MLGSNGFSSSFGKKDPITERGFDENTKLKDVPPEAQIYFYKTIELSQQYLNPPEINGTEEFSHKLTEMTRELEFMILHSLVRLTSDIDYGNGFIESSKNSLDDLQRNTASPNLCLQKQCEKLCKQSSAIKQSITTITENNASKSNSNPNSLTLVIEAQHKAIIRCSGKLAQLQSITLEIKSNIFSRIHYIDTSDPMEPSKPSLIQQIYRNYKNFQIQRKSDFEKRDRDKEKFRKPPPKANAFGSGFSGILAQGSSIIGTPQKSNDNVFAMQTFAPAPVQVSGKVPTFTPKKVVVRRNRIIPSP
ncbi:hypothetical protein GPJ56_009243 [Histomonas meleagridis]|uniref:uncharacterized protein n=1 Tax=Histomonas meleagridis TaxID=135588 RepID=UPI00355A0C1B|nr:hypothetical protein GPJ56_009243 [Histomonas meleagridis]KAH0801614.1 hypothetical protein GO595_005613 [Histomonas meleagridis]